MDAQRLLNVVTTSTLTVLEGLLLALAYLIDHEGKYALDYRCNIPSILLKLTVCMYKLDSRLGRIINEAKI